MATDHGIKPAKPGLLHAHLDDLADARRRFARGRGPRRPHRWRRTPTRSRARGVRDRCTAGDRGTPTPTARPTPRAPASGSRCHPARGPLSPRSVSATCTRCGWRSVRAIARRTSASKFSTTTSASSSSSSSRRPVVGIVHVEHHAALVGVAVRVRERVRWVTRLDADHLGAEVGEDAGAQCAAEIGEVDDVQPRQGTDRCSAHSGRTLNQSCSIACDV